MGSGLDSKRSVFAYMARVWADARTRRRIVVIAVLVASTVTELHILVGAKLPIIGWHVLHASLPAIVYVAGSMATGHCRFNMPFIVRGLLTVLVVTVAFGLVNITVALPLFASLALNFFVPVLVSTFGAAGALADQAQTASPGA